jgi:hypothetical protein
MWENPKAVEAVIKRLTCEIKEIDNFFYGFNEDEGDDRLLYAGMLERKRDDMIRSAVLQMHTAIEHLLNSYITLQITGETRRRSPRSKSARALQQNAAWWRQHRFRDETQSRSCARAYQ